jgi:peptidoglycan L-alanyl-D-glutamate endopeptidase CwlK
MLIFINTKESCEYPIISINCFFKNKKGTAMLVRSIIFCLILCSLSAFAEDNVIIDCQMTFEESIKGTKAPQDVIDDLSLIDVQYYSFDGKLHQGQIVVHNDVKKDVIEIFEIIKDIKYPVQKVIPIVIYNCDDNASMDDNNSSGFNYRFIAGTKRLSNHSSGKAVDINPMNNPYITAKGKVIPSSGKYEPNSFSSFTDDHPVVKAFKERGWRWGGNFNSYKDYHHFDID